MNINRIDAEGWCFELSIEYDKDDHDNGCIYELTMKGDSGFRLSTKNYFDKEWKQHNVDSYSFDEIKIGIIGNWEYSGFLHCIHQLVERESPIIDQASLQQITYRIYDILEPSIKPAINQAIDEHLKSRFEPNED